MVPLQAFIGGFHRWLEFARAVSTVLCWYKLHGNEGFHDEASCAFPAFSRCIKAPSSEKGTEEV